MKRTPLKKISKRLSLGLTKYEKAKKEYLSEHTSCEVCARFTMTCLHHKAGRSGSLLWNKKYFLAVCNACHKMIHDNPKLSYKKGYMLDRLSKSSQEFNSIFS